MNRVFQLGYSLNLAGTETVFMNWYRNIDRSQLQFDFGVLEKFNTPISKEIESLGGKIFVIPRGEGIINRLKFLFRLYKTLKQNGPYIAFQSHDHWLGGLTCMAACFAGISKRITISHFNDGAKKIKLLDYPKRALARLFIRLFSTKKLAVSKDAGETLYGKHLPFTIIKNGIDCKKFTYNLDIRNKIRSKLGLENKFVLGHVGRFSKEKNHTFLIDIFDEIYRRNKNAVLLLLGEGPLKKEIQQKVKKLNLESVVFFEGSKNNIEYYYQAFDVFIFPSLFEGFGIAALEAQCSGLPVFAANTVSKDVRVCNLMFLPLSKGSDFWAEQILINADNFYRKDTSQIILESGFDIKDTASYLQEEYLK